MEIFEKYASEILFEQPIVYFGLKLYPVKMKDVYKFYKCSGVLSINPLDFDDPKVASLTYLDLIINLTLFQEKFRENLIEVLCLTMHIEENDIGIIPEKDEEDMVHYSLQITQNGNVKKINAGVFTKIKNLICCQNGLEVINLRENQEIARARKALAAQSNGRNFSNNK